MATGANLSPRNDNTSVKPRKITLVQAPSASAIANSDYTDVAASENDYSHRNSDPQSSLMLSTSDLKSVLASAWDRARWPRSPDSLSETNPMCKAEVIPGRNKIHSSTKKGTSSASTITYDQPCSNYLNSEVNFVRQLQENLERSKLDQNISFPHPSCKLFLSWGSVLARSAIIDDFSTVNCLPPHTGVPPNWGSVYRWMTQTTLVKQRNQKNSIENTTISDCYTGNCSNNLNIGISVSKHEAAKWLDSSFGTSSSIDIKSPTNTCSENGIIHGQCIEVVDCCTTASISDADFENAKLVSPNQDCKMGSTESSNGLHECQESKGITNEQGNSELKMGMPAKEKPKYALAKQEHAFAGAMAGIFVSLCLHPIDTVKTVLQSCHADKKSLHIIGSSIIAERGILGLYRGFSSNIVSSAPISAVYTYTYESVKKNLLPLFPKEYCSLAHCIAGGCASIATSFIFTPSERIKQQMQVGSHYRNCWNAFIHIVQNGGIPSLYAGWRAVLCRNIPHSVIKFYTYESLKQIMLPSVHSTAQSNVFTTLVCGGLAGSVATLFTTPFDVVKTRLQTQLPGSMIKYNGVLTMLTEIGKCEGLKGLYRGLTPRLVMYMIQGALFFASYESFKRLFSLEVPQLSSQTLKKHKSN